MKIAGVIAEYNPFHNGHAYHLDQTRKACGADGIVAVMSGNFVQRGEPAILSKWERAKAAIQGGVDLVIELPTLWSASNARSFAEGGISLLKHMGCIDVLSFGSECGDIDLLNQAVLALENPEIDEYIKFNQKLGMTYAASRESAIRMLYGDKLAGVFHSPNDVLATEYLRAALKMYASFECFAIPRHGAVHDSKISNESFASASYIRKRIQDGKSIDMFAPASTISVLNECELSGKAPTNLRYMEREIIRMLRSADVKTLASVPDVSEGLENRILEIAKSVDSLDALYDGIKTKRYTHARIRRIILSFVLGIQKSTRPKDVPCIRILGIGKRGTEILNIMKRSTDLPLLSKMTDLEIYSDDVRRTFETELRATELFSFLSPKLQPFGAEFSTPIYIEK